MTNFNLKKNISVTVFAFVANLVLVFISYRLVVMAGGLKALGIWSTLMAWIFVIRLGDVGMATAAIRYVARCDLKTESKRIRVYTDTGILLNSVLFLVLALIGYLYLSRHMDTIFPNNSAARDTALSILPLMLTGFILSNLSGLMVGALRGIHKGYVGAWLTVAGTVTQLVTVLILVPRLGLAGMAWGQVAQHGFMVTVGWCLFLYHMHRGSGVWTAPLPIEFSKVALREMLGFSIKAQIANLANGFFEPLSKILIGRFAGLETLALYEMSYKMVSLPRNAVVSGVQATIPAATRMMETDRISARNLYGRSITLVLRSGAIVLGAVLLISPIVSIFWVGHFEPLLVLFVALMAVGFLGNSMGAPAFMLGMATGRMESNIVSALLSLVIVFVLAVPAGLIGQAWAMVAGVAVALTFGGFYIRWRNEKLLMDSPA